MPKLNNICNVSALYNLKADRTFKKQQRVFAEVRCVISEFNHNCGYSLCLSREQINRLYSYMNRNERYFVFIGKYGIDIHLSFQGTRMLKIVDGHARMGDYILYYHGYNGIEVTQDNCKTTVCNIKYGKRPRQEEIPQFVPTKRMVTEGDWGKETKAYRDGQTARPSRRKCNGHGFWRTQLAHEAMEPVMPCVEVKKREEPIRKRRKRISGITKTEKSEVA